jgi:glutamate racemase
MDNRPIGLFDSGVGGLTVLKQIQEILPRESVIYLGDTQHLPYGDKSKEAIIRFSIENTKFLLRQNVKAILVACNSASSVAVEVLKETFKVPIIGVIEPTIKCISRKKTSSVLVIGTMRTVRSGVYQKKLQELNLGIEIFGKDCPLLVPLVEEGAFLNKGSLLYNALISTLEYYLGEYRGRVSHIVLGCTHYPAIENEIRFVMDGVELVDPGECAALELKEILEKNNMLSEEKNRFEKFFVTDLSEKTVEVAKIILQKEINIEEIYLPES